jgi:hypothetical protein
MPVLLKLGIGSPILQRLILGDLLPTVNACLSGESVSCLSSIGIGIMSKLPTPKSRQDVISKFCKSIMVSGLCYEYRVFGAKFFERSGRIEYCQFARTIVGFYDRPDCMSVDISRLNGVSGYIVPNPINKNFLYKKANGFLMAHRDDCSKEKDVEVTSYIIIDIDSIRHPKKISATDEEHRFAIKRRDAILSDNPKILDSCVFGSTGNGGWILVKCDLPNNENTKDKACRLLGSLATRYNDATVEIDTNCANPNRHLPIPGTVKCKGENTELRPWRLVTIDGGSLKGWL